MAARFCSLCFHSYKKIRYNNFRKISEKNLRVYLFNNNKKEG